MNQISSGRGRESALACTAHARRVEPFFFQVPRCARAPAPGLSRIDSKRQLRSLQQHVAG